LFAICLILNNVVPNPSSLLLGFAWGWLRRASYSSSLTDQSNTGSSATLKMVDTKAILPLKMNYQSDLTDLPTTNK
jgi:hypothetical protein